MNPAPGEFRGTARFAPLGRLGAGGMGIVYRALDRERGVEVALKTLSNVSAATIFRFKQEFRALADVAHPNLVTLHELFCEDGRWFFTMELVDGIDLLTYVCGQANGGGGDGPSLATLVDTGAPVPAEKPRRGRPLIARLRHTLPQLVAGLCALHDSGHLHHDVKPSNVLVTPDGRVVVLDFGVVTEIGAYNEAGTPAYMAPEHARAAPATPASDWYSVGVLLYETLAGLRPFTGSHMQIIWDKAHGEPVSPQLVRPDTPADLDRLCCDLLRIRPEDRPSGRDILARLGAHDRRGRQVAVPVASEPALVGRDAHLAALREAFARSRAGAVVALVHGASGTGKSALVRAFADGARRDADALVFAGRCYERESVPYKAIDTVIDALCEHLLALPEPERAALLPRDADLLATLFPVLRRLPALAEAAAPELANRPHRLRQRAFTALRQLFARIAAQRPLVIVIDDLQWGDADSAPLLEALVRAPGAPALLLAGCYRDDEAKRSPLLQAWLPADRVDVAVGALAPVDALAIATAAFRAEGADDALAGAVALESGGNPFFLHELVRFVAAARSEQIPSLDDVIRARVARVGGDARRLIDVLAVAGRPVEQRVAQHAAEIDDAQWPVLVQRVGAARIVRVSGRRGDDYIEAYHDRIHEAALATLATDAAARIHSRLALALQSATQRDPEMIARHFEAAGDVASAARYALRAAESAAAALAFDRAVALYRRAVALGADVRLALAGALVNAGRGAEAAQLYLDAAAAGAPGASALELRRLAAEQLLRSGHVDAGLVVLADVLRAAGMTLPATAARSIPSLAWRRARLRLRGLAPAARTDPSPRLLARLDAARTATLGLALFDPVRAATFSTQHVRLALASGDEQRIAFALALEAGYNASARKQRRALDLLARADAIATATGHPMLLGAVGVIRAIASYERGEFRAAFDACERVEELIHEHLTGTAWELRTVQLFALHSLFFLGDFRELTRRTALYVADARERGDRYAIMNIRTLAANLGHVVMRDDVAAAKAELADVAAELPASGFYLQHVFLCYAHALFDLYAGDGERAYRELAAWHPRVKASLLLHDRSVRMFWCYLRGAAAATIGRAGEARRAARALAADGARPYVAMAHQLRAAATSDPERACADLAIASELFEAADMRLYALFTRRRYAQLAGGDVSQHDAQARDELVAVPAHAARCLAPGFPDG